MNEWEALEKECDKIEQSALSRIQKNYDNALRKAIADCAELLNTVHDIDIGKIKPPDKVAEQGENAIKRWRQDYVRKLTWKSGTAAKVAEDLQKAGVSVPDTLRDAMKSVYRKNYKTATSALEAEGNKANTQISFHQYDTRQLDVLMEQSEGVFSKIAYSQFENPALLTSRLQDQLYQATMLGEDRKAIISRIRNVTGYEYNRAKRIAQTERTRVQSQARFRAGQDAAAAGVEIENEWSCAMMPTSRDTHKDLNGQRVKQGEWFELSDGDKLRYPGDPAGKACNIINCYCVMIPHVALPNKKVAVDERLHLHGDVMEENAYERYTAEQIEKDKKASIENFALGIDEIGMLVSSDDMQERSDGVEHVLVNRYGLKKGKWSGITKTVEKTYMPNAKGQKEWTCDITITKGSLIETTIHEHIHARSISMYGDTMEARLLMAKWRNVEEGTVQYLTNVICKENGLIQGDSYKPYVGAIKHIYDIAFSEMGEIEFAKNLIDIPLDKRYNILEKMIQSAVDVKKINSTNQTKLQREMEVLRGGAR